RRARSRTPVVRQACPHRRRAARTGRSRSAACRRSARRRSRRSRFRSSEPHPSARRARRKHGSPAESRWTRTTSAAQRRWPGRKRGERPKRQGGSRASWRNGCEAELYHVTRRVNVAGPRADLLDETEPPRALTVLEGAAAGAALEIVPLLLVLRADAAHVRLDVVQRLIALGAHERRRRDGRLARFAPVVRAAQHRATAGRGQPLDQFGGAPAPIGRLARRSREAVARTADVRPHAAEFAP